MVGGQVNLIKSIIINNNNKISHINRLHNEILSKIIYQVLISSNFSLPNHRCHVYNSYAIPVNTCFHDLPQRLAFQILPRINFSSGNVAGNVSVKRMLRMLRMFGPSSGVMPELPRITSNKKWANA